MSRNKPYLEYGLSRAVRMHMLTLVHIYMDACHLDSAVTVRHGRIMALDSRVTVRSKFSSNDKGVPKQQVTLNDA